MIENKIQSASFVLARSLPEELSRKALVYEEERVLVYLTTHGYV
jgi:hypothetical protein